MFKDIKFQHIPDCLQLFDFWTNWRLKINFCFGLLSLGCWNVICSTKSHSPKVTLIMIVLFLLYACVSSFPKWLFVGVLVWDLCILSQAFVYLSFPIWQNLVLPFGYHLTGIWGKHLYKKRLAEASLVSSKQGAVHWLHWAQCKHCIHWMDTMYRPIYHIVHYVLRAAQF